MNARRYLFLLLFSSALLTQSCNKEEKEWVVWFETYCADPWFGNPNQSAAINAYLENEGIEVFNVLKNNNLYLPQSCSECDCRNGNVFRVRILSEDVEAAKALGFVPEEN